MINTGKLAGLTVFITGASRGIGKEIGKKVAQDGANVVIAAKTAEPHPKLKGTVYTAAEEIEAAGGSCLPCIVDVRDESQVASAVQKAVEKFGGIDIVINNCSAISLTGTLSTDMKKYDLMNQVNARGTFLTSKLCLPYLLKSRHPHILNISPPLNLNPVWFKQHVAYTIAKYGMSMCALGMAEEFKDDKIGVNCLWPRTAIWTAAMEMLSGAEVGKGCRKAEIMADAAYAILCKNPATCTGNFFIDDEVLSKEGIVDFKQYLLDPSSSENLMPDFFLDEALIHSSGDELSGRINNEDLSIRVNDIMEVIKKSLSPELVQSTQAVYQFNTNDGQHSWFVDLKTGTGNAGNGQAPSPPDTILIANLNDVFDVLTGKIKPVNAVLSGKLSIKGNMQKAMKLEKLMHILKSKL
ncbi:hypothetical protein V9T40_013635 [Parthenolecanium corni]|uniref:Hydroxysteroid dehydrogenase-like protein 2 n=1 Tax=Parthenolecanium corni TaxID=536013 RepID=A0AAN9Y1J2_9HEMI